MGKSISQLKEQQKINDDETIEQLQILEKMVSSKVQIAADKIALQARRDTQLPISAIVDRTQKFMIKVENKPGDIEKAINDLFDGKFLKSLKDALVIAINELLGNTAAGESAVTDFHIAYANNAFIRVDYFVYHYVFSSKGLITKMKNALGYVVQVGVLDIGKIDKDVALYEISKCINKENFQGELEKLHDDIGFLDALVKSSTRPRQAELIKPGIRPSAEAELSKSSIRFREPRKHQSSTPSRQAEFEDVLPEEDHVSDMGGYFGNHMRNIIAGNVYDLEA